MLAMNMAVIVWKKAPEPAKMERAENIKQWLRMHGRNAWPFIIFGIALGMAAASKINALAAAILLPLAVLLRRQKESEAPSGLHERQQIGYIIASAIISFLTFRFFQPYAFQGGLFSFFSLNPEWIADLKELALLSSGISNYPPSLQWARRSIAFPVKNLIVWGLGIPFGLFAIVGMVYMGIEIVRGKWKKYALIWIWILVYGVWQVTRWNPTMRYLLLVYPALAIIAAWFACRLAKSIQKRKSTLRFLLTLLLGSFLIGGTGLWSLAFAKVYQKPMTRIAASEWIYDHIEGAINIRLKDETGEFIQALAYPHDFTLMSGREMRISFRPEMDGEISAVQFDHILNNYSDETGTALIIEIRETDDQGVISQVVLNDRFAPQGDGRGNAFTAALDQIIPVKKNKNYTLTLKLDEENTELKFYGTLGISLNSEGRNIQQAILEFSPSLQGGETNTYRFVPKRSATLEAIDLFRVRNISGVSNAMQIQVQVLQGETNEILGGGEYIGRIGTEADYRGEQVRITLNEPIELDSDSSYVLLLRIGGTEDQMLINGSKTAKETDWDDALPLYMYGLSPFDRQDGVYQSDLNLQMYWDDNEEKRQRFLNILDQSDYIVITSNRQWGSITQIPEKYPLSTYFYQELIGCRQEDVQWCYRVAQPGMFAGGLGFELEKVFQSNPGIFGWEFNSQFAEEAFTVYDHPKVLIFKKTSEFDLETTAKKLYRVDLEKVLNLNPAEAEQHTGNLMLSEDRFHQQIHSGTWSQLFSYEDLINRSPFASVMLWYLFISFVGWVFYPSGRLVFSGLRDKGFAIHKLLGLILWTFLVWWLGSSGISASRINILLVLAACLILNGGLAWKNRKEIWREIKEKKKLFITIEIFALVFFLFFIAIRLGNPDLWHPFKGGEKPMDFSFLNAVLKSDEYPPYDPWYAGGYINYYYYGFMLAAVPVKLLGIIPSIAYNLILATFFSFSGMAAFCFGLNLNLIQSKLTHFQKKTIPFIGYKKIEIHPKPYLLAVLCAVFVLCIGNLGSAAMIVQGFQKIATQGSAAPVGNIFQAGIQIIKGMLQYLAGERFPYYPGDWYWIPSRTIPGEPITEFPFFTFLYGDPHAHMFAYPITIMVLCWILAVLKKPDQGNQDKLPIFQLCIGALVVGTLRPTNTWDFPVFLLLAILAILVSIQRRSKIPDGFFNYLPTQVRKVLWMILIGVGFIALSLLAYSPFSRWYGQAYSAIDYWEGEHTPITSYLMHWGFYLFIIYSFAFSEVRNWMAVTPISALKPWVEKRHLLVLFLLLFVGGMSWLLWKGVQMAILSVPIGIILGLLFLRRDYSDEMRMVILLALAGLGLTLMVELIVLHGDIGRMNTVFKFYLQAWTFLSLSAAFFFYQLFPKIQTRWSRQSKHIWKTIFFLLCTAVVLFPITGSIDKMQDRISVDVPLTLDGMEFMRHSTYMEKEYLMDLSQDYQAIRWMQENVEGTPVIIEGNVSEYRWGNRFSIYTGLPAVVGWNWHQRQQRAINPSDWVYERVNEVNEFYQTSDLKQTEEIIQNYTIEYIVVGQLERAMYSSEGLKKFSDQEGILWDLVYSSKDTEIYRVKKTV